MYYFLLSGVHRLRMLNLLMVGLVVVSGHRNSVDQRFQIKVLAFVSQLQGMDHTPCYDHTGHPGHLPSHAQCRLVQPWYCWIEANRQMVSLVAGRLAHLTGLMAANCTETLLLF